MVAYERELEESQPYLYEFFVVVVVQAYDAAAVFEAANGKLQTGQ